MDGPGKNVKRALVTGAGGTLGAELCRELLGRGFSVIGVDRDEDAGMRLEAEFARETGPFRFRPLDVGVADEWGLLADELHADHLGLALLVNAAGMLVTGPLADIPEVALIRSIQVNLLGTILGCRACLGLLSAADDDGGRILNIASCNAFLPIPWSAAYNASKAGVVAFSRTLAAELMESNVRVTVVCPGFFAS
ncbi:MAG TPA: SDR family NAD(P)-dependent oxidoreductase, partial [Pirellulaceae bacterium]